MRFTCIKNVSFAGGGCLRGKKTSTNTNFRPEGELARTVAVEVKASNICGTYLKKRKEVARSCRQKNPLACCPLLMKL
ncbi:hypothetical protein DPMN_131690 [Dreissena polymorpha]|uniref:Uncharacterized protein n=1 Tax=Dreissena polymorpha TaxID=45954 RepID=A0A9D4FTM2_DREPO|nr:hypothetical protein DPMN_131690 [Dreissena polymorpha]